MDDQNAMTYGYIIDNDDLYVFKNNEIEVVVQFGVVLIAFDSVCR